MNTRWIAYSWIGFRLRVGDSVTTTSVLTILFLSVALLGWTLDLSGLSAWFMPVGLTGICASATIGKLPGWCMRTLVERRAIVVSIALAAVPIAFAGLNSYTGAASPEVLLVLEQEGQLLQSVAVPRLTWMLTFAASGWALLGVAVFEIAPKRWEIPRMTAASVAASSLLWLPVLIGLSGYFALQMTDWPLW